MRKGIRFFVTIFSLAVAVIFVTAGFETQAAGQTTQKGGAWAPALSEDFSLYYIEGESSGPLMVHLSQNEPPLLKSHSLTPQNPAPVDEIKVLAEISNNPVVTSSETMEASLFYSTDGKKTWEEMEMENESGDNRIWTATIPPVENSGTLYYYFTAMDDADNYYWEIPEVYIQWAGKQDKIYINTTNDDNSIYTMVPDDLDILSFSIGYDGDYIYVSMVVEGDISGGTVAPFEANIYSAGFYIPTERMQIGPKPRYVLMHAQHAQFLQFPIVGLLDVEENLSEMRNAESRYYSRNNRLYMRIKENFLSDRHKYEYIRMAAGTAIGTNPIPLEIKPKDVTSFFNVVFGEHSIEIR